jgi:N-acetylglutamate synthase-like GNAT family acetyltransferase
MNEKQAINRLLFCYHSPMENFRLRRAEERDAGRIRELVIQGKINPFGLDWRRFILAEDPDGRVIGCVQRKPHRDGSIELASLAVDEAARSQGVARALVEAFTALHVGDLYLMCRSDLEGFYQKFGFRMLEPEEMPPYFQRVMRMVNTVNWVTRYDGSPLIMYRECGQSEVDRYPQLVG